MVQQLRLAELGGFHLHESLQRPIALPQVCHNKMTCLAIVLVAFKSNYLSTDG